MSHDRDKDALAEEAPKEKRGFFSRFKRNKAHSGVDIASSPAMQEETPNPAEPAPPKGNVALPEESQIETGKKGFFGKLKEGLQKTRQSISGRLGNLFLATKSIDEELLEELEELLIGADIGVQTSMDIIEKVRKEVSRKTLKNGEELKTHIKSELREILKGIPDRGFHLDKTPTIILVVGVNGVGKTTTIGKVARLLQSQGKSVLMCAADTFRAAAEEQLEIWSKRAGVNIVMKPGSNDPAAVVFEALDRAKKESTDVLLIDTAGRLHNNPNLMSELEKIRRITTRHDETAPHHVLLILDAVTGQNGLQQAKQFVAKVGVTDLVLTKLDGTAKGGIAIAIAKELNLPIQYLGVGEQMDDLIPFDADRFVDSLFED